MVVSRRLGLFPIVHGGERTTHGEVFFPLGVLLTAALVPHRLPYVFGVLVLALSDAVAGLAGGRFGRRSYRLLGAHKTYLGSAVFFAATIVLGIAALVASDPVSVRGCLAVAAISAAVTLEEGLTGGGADNVVLPVSAAALWRALL